ncbi:MAG: hypothetical protein L0221_05565 [Chloroflexi bacterium]|nr:hypothetical protein [Chloroflexota bacterium]
MALGALAGVLAICMVVPAFDASCPMGSGPTSGLAACAAQPGFRAVALAGLATGAIVGLLVLGSIGVQAVLHHRLTKRLRQEARPAVLGDHAVGLVPGVGAALVAGLRRPRTYCSADIATRLGAEELRAVLLHERHHELVHAPARLVVLSALAPFISRLDAGSAWLQRRRAEIEIAADRHAIAAGAARATLARAIVKLNEAAPTLTVAGFASAGDLRLRALLGDESGPEDSKTRSIWPAIGAAVVVAVLCSALPMR